MPTDRVAIGLPPETVVLLRERQAQLQQETGLRVSLAEIARRLIALGLASDSRYVMSPVSSGQQ